MSAFLSYSRKDQDFVRDLYRRLTRDGVDCFLDEQSIEPGANWVIALERALDVCEHVVLVLSPAFLASEWAQLERTSALTKNLVPLMLSQCDTPRFLKVRQTLDVSTPDQFEANYPRICRALGGEPRTEQNEPTHRTKLPPPYRLPERNRLPYRSLGANFVGRIEPFWKLHDALHRDPTAIVQGAGILAGTGGLGKTQLAIEYAYRFAPEYKGGVYWVDADRGLSALIAQVSDAAQIEIDGKRPEQDQLDQLWRALPRPALLILDNVPENAQVEPYLPKGGGVHAIVTTRSQNLGHKPIRLSMLTTPEGVQLLNSGTRTFSDADAATLVERLGGLPLALELAKSHLNVRGSIAIADLPAELDATGEIDLLARTRLRIPRPTPDRPRTRHRENVPDELDPRVRNRAERAPSHG